MIKTDDELKAEFLARRGATVLPAHQAAGKHVELKRRGTVHAPLDTITKDTPPDAVRRIRNIRSAIYLAKENRALKKQEQFAQTKAMKKARKKTTIAGPN